MRTILAKLFKRSAEPSQAAAPEPAPAAPRKPAGTRRYRKGKPRHPAPRGASKADWNEPILRGGRR
ncbi:hypothetical protein [Burkholderia pseudomallei]|uniref:hypothetical protein n=1 Tax=Burkholderia pseudomallei TaxID=28450 RepID=UPI000AA54318|nr:hypothetical protein [Burkholderia pseudomallei]